MSEQTQVPVQPAASPTIKGQVVKAIPPEGLSLHIQQLVVTINQLLAMKEERDSAVNLLKMVLMLNKGKPIVINRLIQADFDPTDELEVLQDIHANIVVRIKQRPGKIITPQ